MSKDYLSLLTHVARGPRHVAGDAATVFIEVEREPGLPAQSVVEILDFSRDGCRLGTEKSLRCDESIVIRAVTVTNDLLFETSGRVRWSEKDAAGGWTAGCQFSAPLDYAQLGELFLCGVLSTEPG